MLVKRIAMFTISMIIGIAIQFASLSILETNYEEFGWGFFWPSAFFIGLGVAIWLDKFMKTDILKH